MIQRRLKNKANWLTILAMLVPTGVWAAGGPKKQSDLFYTSRNPHISLTNLDGTVIIDGWEKPQVHAIYVIAAPQIEIDKATFPPSGQADKIELATHLLNERLQGPRTRVDYTLQVPADSYLEVRNPQGVVRIQGLRGDVWVDSVGGDIYVVRSSGEVVAHSVGGLIRIVRPAGPIEASSVTGNLSFVSPSSPRIRARTTSGQILYEGNLMATGDYVMSSYSGDINVLCPPSASFELKARSVHGKLVNELALNRRRHHSSVSFYGNSLFGTHNEGDASLELTSFSGTIRIRPEPEPHP